MGTVIVVSTIAVIYITKKKMEQFKNVANERMNDEVDKICNYCNVNTANGKDADLLECDSCMKGREARSKWVDNYNNSLPQQKYYDSDEEEHSAAVGGIYDSEEMNFVHDNLPSRRIAMAYGEDGTRPYEPPTMTFFRTILEVTGETPSHQVTEEWREWRLNNPKEFEDWYLERRVILPKEASYLTLLPGI